jgi:hypothetical protein
MGPATGSRSGAEEDAMGRTRILPAWSKRVVFRLGYDARAFGWWCGIAWVAMLIAFFLLPATASDSLTPANVNYVFGLDGPQTRMPAWAWFASMLVAVPLVVTLPAHLALKRLRGVGRAPA